MKPAAAMRVAPVSTAGARSMSNRNTLYFLGGVMVAALIGGAVWMYQDSRRAGVEITVGRGGLSIQER
jgi:hypothetical protein